MIREPYAKNSSELEQMIADDEGYRAKPYRCPAGRLTVGYGYNLDAGMPDDEALVLMRYRLHKLDVELTARLPWYGRLPIARKTALLNMAYQLGLGGLLAFKRMLAACAVGDWPRAAQEALDSKWARVDTPARAQRVVAMLEAG